MSMVGKVNETVKAETQAEPPRTLLDKVITSTPVVMTVVATILAGLSSSEMSTAQYHRAIAAQNQSKAGDQWAFYQAKRNRGASIDNTLDLLETEGNATSLDVRAVEQSATRLADQIHSLNLLAMSNSSAGASTNAATGPSAAEDVSPGALTPAIQQDEQAAKKLATQWQSLMARPETKSALTYLQSNRLPEVDEQQITDEDVKQALAAIESEKPEPEINALAQKVDAKKFRAATAVAQQNARAFDSAVKPVEKQIDAMTRMISAQAAVARRVERETKITAPTSTASPSTTSKEPSSLIAMSAAFRQAADQVASDFIAARLNFLSRKYQAESRYNMASAQLFELDVHRSGAASERHRVRSRNFFYGMLAAQAAVTIATLSLAVKQRSLLWSLATGAGALAVALGIYVYLFT